MPTIKLLIVSNGCNWQSWPQKINDLTAFLRVSATSKLLSFTNIPFLTFAPMLTAYEVYPAGAKSHGGRSRMVRAEHSSLSQRDTTLCYSHSPSRHGH